MSRQATITVGTIGHVAHGKTTLVKAISGIHRIRSKIEKERNILYNLGYANAKLYKCKTCPDQNVIVLLDPKRRIIMLVINAMGT